MKTAPWQTKNRGNLTLLKKSVLEAVRIGSRLPNQADDDAGVVVEEAGGPLFPAMQVPSLPYPL